VIGLDANVLLRWLTGPDQWNTGSNRSELALVERTLSAAGAEFFVNLIVLAETTWMLEQKLKLDRATLCEVIDRMLFSTNIRVDDAVAVGKARSRFEASNVGFADCLIASINSRAGCEYTLTFDKKAGRQAGFRNIQTRD
jgi:predicted nucleic-acid-binding protein